MGASAFGLEIRASNESVTPAGPQGTPLQRPFSGFDFGQLPDGSTYVRWDGVGEALISRSGQAITCFPFPHADWESFHVYLLGQALSFALVKGGFEPLHATAVVFEGQAVAFLGDCGFGKSTLAAAFIQEGHRLLTDDLLLLETTARGIVAFPGPARIKIFPEVALRFLGRAASGISLNPKAQKQIIPLNDSQMCVDATPLGAIYALASSNGDQAIRIAPLTEREAFIDLLGSTFNRQVVDANRLRRQFEFTHNLANLTTVRRLSYPRLLERLPLVLEAILSDLAEDNFTLAACKP